MASIPQLVQYLWTIIDLLVVILGFSLIIVLHELGHFIAARWAGIRVLAFAVGFGPALLSYRKGLGWRRGSSEAELKRLLTDEEARNAHGPGAISATEYRLNLLPFGGYVKMLGQDDTNPAARSDEPDSFQNCPVWKRMIVISAGVATNIAVACLLFIAVYAIGRETEPPWVGAVEPGSPASIAVALNAGQLGITEPGLKPGDVIVNVNGRKPEEFTDVGIAAAMAHRGSVLDVEVKRPGAKDTLLFQVQPRESPATHMLQMGVEPMLSATLVRAGDERDQRLLRTALDRAGLAEIDGGMALTLIAGKDVTNYADIQAAFQASGGEPVDAVFQGTQGARTVRLRARREFSTARFQPADGSSVTRQHLLGLMPVMRVESVSEGGAAAGLRDGDVFSRLGSSEWPSVPAGMAEIKSRRGKTVRAAVWRRDRTGTPGGVDLGDVQVASDGTVGFLLGDTTFLSARVASWPDALVAPDARGAQVAAPPPPSAAGLGLASGSVIVEADHKPVANLSDVLDAVLRAAAAAPDADVTLQLRYTPPISGVVGGVGGQGESPVEEVAWRIPATEIREVRRLSWASPIGPELFPLETFRLIAPNPVRAVAKGLKDTRRVLQNTYLTFARLFQGSVKVEHLKGPVGIADIGTQLARRGPVWLMFFMALVSVNLAVVNFLPIPIADGGHFVYLLYEQATGRPVSPAVQNIAAMAGLLLIGGLFLLVTYNDLSHLISGWLR